MAIAELFNLCTKGGLSSVEVEYLIVKDYCEKYELDSIETYALMKALVARVYNN